MKFFDGPVCRDDQATASGQREIVTNAVGTVGDMIRSRAAEHAAQFYCMRDCNNQCLENSSIHISGKFLVATHRLGEINGMTRGDGR